MAWESAERRPWQASRLPFARRVTSGPISSRHWSGIWPRRGESWSSPCAGTACAPGCGTAIGYAWLPRPGRASASGTWCFAWSRPVRSFTGVWAGGRRGTAGASLPWATERAGWMRRCRRIALRGGSWRAFARARCWSSTGRGCGSAPGAGPVGPSSSACLSRDGIGPMGGRDPTGSDRVLRGSGRSKIASGAGRERRLLGPRRQHAVLCPPESGDSGERAQEWPGGWRTLRGHHGDRLVADAAMQGSLELRWRAVDVTVLNRHLRWKVAGAVGWRIAWNPAALVGFESRMGSEAGLFYMEIGHPLRDVSRRA